MRPNRRTVLLGGAALALASPSTLRAAETAERRFLVFRGGSDIGGQTTRVRGSGDRAEVEVEVDLAVKILGITAYRYKLRSRETWEKGLLMSLEGETDDDGEVSVAKVRRTSEGLVSEGTWEGPVPSDAATTTYWTQAFLERPVWISTQTGKPLDVSVSRDGEERIEGFSGEVLCQRWRVSGDLPLTLYYDDRGEWMGNAFDASGERARFQPTEETGRLAPLWPRLA
ncbi:MAG TPA: DUF6134 family protein [Paracoccaceae bacterium]|nr:DUF6134 family protein [Paracoccaceae bacterium]